MSSKLDRGINMAVIRHHYGINKLTTRSIYFIKQNEDKIRGSNQASDPVNIEISCVSCHHILLKKTARALCVCGQWQSMLLKETATPNKG
jgi:hypothetical protein